MLARITRNFSNPFKILGIPENSSKEQVKLAYYRLAKKYHPDVNSDFQEEFKVINQAYKQLESNGFKYEKIEKGQRESPQEEFVRTYRMKKKRKDFDTGKKNWVLAEVLVMVGLGILVLFRGILIASANHKQKIIDEQNQNMLLEEMEEFYDEDEGVVRFIPKDH